PEAEDVVAASIAGPGLRAGDRPSTDIAGTTLEGDAVKIAVGPASPPTLLAFLTSGCTSCQGFWEAFGSSRRESLLPGVRLGARRAQGPRAPRGGQRAGPPEPRPGRPPARGRGTTRMTTAAAAVVVGIGIAAVAAIRSAWSP